MDFYSEDNDDYQLHMDFSDKQREIFEDTEHDKDVFMLRGSGSTTAIVVSALRDSMNEDYRILVFGRNTIGFENVIKHIFEIESELFNTVYFSVTYNSDGSITVKNKESNSEIRFMEYRRNLLYDNYYRNHNYDVSKLFYSIYFDCVNIVSNNDYILLPFLVSYGYKRVYSIEPFSEGNI